MCEHKTVYNTFFSACFYYYNILYTVHTISDKIAFVLLGWCHNVYSIIEDFVFNWFCHFLNKSSWFAACVFYYV